MTRGLAALPKYNGPRYNAVVFYGEGVLVDSERLVARALAQQARAYGLPLLAHEADAQFRGLNLADTLKRLEGLASLHDRVLPSSFAADLRQHVEYTLLRRLQPIDGASELLRSYSGTACVVSNSRRGLIEQSLSQCGLLPHLDGNLFSAYEVGFWQPDPALLLHAAHALRVSPTRCAMVTACISGAESALRAGMTVFFLECGRTASRTPADVQVVGGLRELIPRLSFHGSAHGEAESESWETMGG